MGAAATGPAGRLLVPRVCGRLSALLVCLALAAVASATRAASTEDLDPDVQAWLLGGGAGRTGLQAEAGYRLEYDSNVPSGPDNLLVPGIGADRSDLRHALFGDLVGRYDLGRGWSLFGEAHLNAGFHQTLSQYDHFTHDWVASLGWSGRRWGFRLPLEFEQILLDGERLQDVFSAAPGVILQATPQLQLYPFLRWEHRGFRQAPAPAEQRDGSAWFGGLTVAWSTPDGATAVRGIFDYGREDLEGRNWQRDRWHAYLRLDQRLTKRLSLVLGGEIHGYDHDHLHDAFLVRRDDTRYSGFGALRYAFSSHWSLDLSGIVIHNSSNIDLYAFDRYVVSGGLTWRY